MPALDFPATPTNGQVYTQDGSSWTYDSTKGAWRSSPYEPGAAITSATAPTNPQNGDIWFNTNDGTLYTYYNDGTTAQWVEVRSEIARSQVGLVPIMPSSIVVGSGTGSVDVAGLVTISGVNSISLNGVFTSAYNHYKLLFQPTVANASGDYTLQFRNAGTNTTANYYTSGYMYTSEGATGAAYYAGNNVGQAYIGRLWNTAGGASHSSLSLEISQPKIVGRTFARFETCALDTAGRPGLQIGAVLQNNDVGTFDGFTISTTVSGVFSGTMKVWGFN